VGSSAYVQKVGSRYDSTPDTAREETVKPFGRRVDLGPAVVAGGSTAGHYAEADMGKGTEKASAFVLRCTKHAAKGGGSVGKVRPICVASSVPTRVRHVSVFLIDRDGQFKYCDLEPPAEVMGSFKIRGDNQIMSLEILSIALGAWTAWLLCVCSRNVCIVACQDCRASQRKSLGETSLSGQTTQEQNRPPEKVGNSHWAICTRREHLSYLAPPGATKNFDQNCLVHAIWKKLVELDTCVWIQRVPTKDNISDLPSRWPSFELICTVCLCRLHCSQGGVSADAQYQS